MIEQKVAIANELLRNMREESVLYGLVKRYIFSLNIQLDTKDKNLMTLDVCISYIAETGFVMKGWRLVEIYPVSPSTPIYVSFMNATTNQEFDLDLYDEHKAHPVCLHDGWIPHRTNTIEEAIAEYNILDDKGLDILEIMSGEYKGLLGEIVDADDRHVLVRLLRSGKEIEVEHVKKYTTKAMEVKYEEEI